ncbi:carboxylesterase family protein [Streptomyces erythrochromogenes]|uniref:carboxylesterase family protein n=1 Tax=Streptomyces erythrochromogenes TaxID=285574 RepID=UPI0038142A1E
MAAPDRHPADLLLSGAGTDIDVLIGWTREEANCAFALSEPYAGTTREQVLARARAAFGSRAAEACTAYEEARPGARPLDVLMDLITDELFRMPGVALAERRAARGRPVWAYRFNLPTPAHDGRLGAAHCLELPFVFDNFDKWSRAPFLAGLAPGCVTVSPRPCTRPGSPSSAPATPTTGPCRGGTATAGTPARR